MSKKWIMGLLLALCCCTVARADEGMWLIQCLNQALEKNMKARGLKLGAREIYNEEAGGLSDAVVSLGFYCTGSMISEDGLLITNHHCAYSDIAALSNARRNFLEDGFWARSRAEEIPIRGKEFYFLKKVLDVTDEVDALQKDLLAKGQHAGSRRISSIMERKYAQEYPGMEASLATMWSGIQYYMCLYVKYTDIRLVGAPPVTVAAFGGDEDNWEWPQHKADFALYRIYDNGEPLHPSRHLSISRKGYREGDFTMVIGYPGSTRRYASAAEMDQEINVERPVANRLRGRQMDILRKWMDEDPAIRRNYSNAFFGLSNLAEMQEGEGDCMKRFGVIERRRKEEEGMHAFNEKTAVILDSLNALYAEYAHIEQQKVYYRETLIRSMILGQSLLRMGGAGRDGIPHQRTLLGQGFNKTDARVEKELLTFSIQEFLSHMDTMYLRPIHREMKARFGTDYQAMSQWIWDNSCVAGFGEKPVGDILRAYQGPIAEDYLYRYIRELNIVDLNSQEDIAALNDLRRRYARARYRYLDAQGVVQYPDANSTMRLSYGRVTPIRPWDGVYVHWQSTARGLREKYDPNKYDFCYPNSWKYMLPPPDFPVNFLTDNDITGGNSGSPVLNARGELIGLAFDGNKESLASNYEAVPGYNMCVCVDIRYVMWVIQYQGRQEYILKELGLL